MNETPPPLRPRRTRAIALLALIASGTVVLAVSLSQVRPSGPSPSGADRTAGSDQSSRADLPPGAPSVVDGLRVMTVAELLAATAGAPSDRPFAVAGWYSQAPIDSCPAPFDFETGKLREIGELELYCQVGDWGLTQLDEPVVDVVKTSNSISTSGRVLNGPSFQPVSVWPFGVEGILNLADPNATPWTPAPMVVIGHVHDPRAGLCEPDQRPACQERFVIDHVAWERGQDHPATNVTDGLGGSTPKLTVSAVIDLARQRLGGSPIVLETAARRTDELAVPDDPSVSFVGVDGPLAWEVRGLVVIGGATHLVTVVVSDSSGGVTWTSLAAQVPRPS